MTRARAAHCARVFITWIHFISSSRKQQGTLASKRVEVNIKNERFTVVCSRVVIKTLNLEVSRCHLADYVKELY